MRGTPTRRAFLRAGAAAGIGTLAGCGGGGEEERETPDPNTVSMVTDGGAYYFDPIGMFVEPGTTVTWRNERGRHATAAYAAGNSIASVTRIPEGAEAWASETFTRREETFEWTVEVPGTYDYFCLPHKSVGMVGRLVVGEPSGPAEGSQPPDGAVPEGSTIAERGRVRYDAFR